MTEYVITWADGQTLPNQAPAGDLFMSVDAEDATDLDVKMWDLCGTEYDAIHQGEAATRAMDGRREVLAEHWMEVDRCGACDTRTILAMKFSNLGRIHVNAARGHAGNLVLTRPRPQALPIARALPMSLRFGRTNLRTTHVCNTSRRSTGVHA